MKTLSQETLRKAKKRLSLGASIDLFGKKPSTLRRDAKKRNQVLLLESKMIRERTKGKF